MKKRSLFFSTCLVGLAGCQSTKTSDGSIQSVEVVSGFGRPLPADCGEGADSFAYQPVGFEGVNPSDLTLTGEFELAGQRPEDDSSGYRLDFCFDQSTGAVSFERMVQRMPQMSPFSTRFLEFKPDQSNATAEMWEESLGGGGHDALEVTFRNEEDLSQSYLLKGWKSSSGQNFVTISNFDWESGDRYATTRSHVKFGALAQGDPWITTFRQHDRLIDTPQLRIELRYKIRHIQNGYKLYRVEGVKVIDRNPALGSPFEGEIDPENSDQFEIVATHHSLSDQFIIRFPHAEYVVGMGVTASYTSEDIPFVRLDVQCGQVSTCGEPF